MALTLITGPANAGKTGEVFARLEAAVARGQRATLLLPTGPDVRRVRAEVARRCPVGVDVAQIDRYLSSRWARYGDGRRLVGRIARRTHMERAVAAHGSDERHPAGVVRAMQAIAQVAPAEAPGGELAGRYASMLATYRTALLEAGLVEATEAHHRLTALERDRPEVIVAHRFTDLSAAQEAYLVHAAADDSQVSITLTWEEGRSATRALDSLVERVLGSGAEHVLLGAGPESFGDADLQRLAVGFCQEMAAEGPSRPGPGVRMLEAHGPEGEARAVVEAIEGLLDSGIAAERIAVVHRAPAGVIERLVGRFEATGVRVDVDVPVAMRDTAFGRALVRLLAFTETSAASELVALLRTPYMGVERDVGDQLERRWRRFRVEGRPRLLGAVAGASPAAAAILRAAEQAQGERDPRAAAALWRRAIDLMLTSASGTTAPILLGDRRHDADAHRVVAETLEELESIGPIRAAALREALAEVSVQPAAVERPGHVQVMGARRARSRRFTAVVLLGLEGDVFPRPGGEGLASDAVTSLASRFGVRRSAEHGIDGERLLFYQVVTRAAERLVLVRQALDESGDERRASTLWHEVVDVFGPDAVAAAPARAEDPAIAAAPRVPPSRSDALTDAGVLSELEARDTFSASELEAYLACPFRWFYQRVLRPDEIDATLSHREFGGVAHRVLETTYRRLADLPGVGRVDPGSLGSALSLADEAFTEALADLPAATDLMEKEGLRQARMRVRGSLRADAGSYPGFEFTAAEWGFGMDDEPHQVGGFRLRGRVDRIDRRGDDLVIMDYKWSSGSSHGAFADRGVVQLPLYARVASERLGGRVAAGLYRGLGAEQDRGFAIRGAVEGEWLKPRAHDWVDEAGVELLIEDAIARAETAVRGIRAGRVPAEPRLPDACRYCEAGSFCGGCAR